MRSFVSSPRRAIAQYPGLGNRAAALTALWENPVTTTGKPTDPAAAPASQLPRSPLNIHPVAKTYSNQTETCRGASAILTKIPSIISPTNTVPADVQQIEQQTNDATCSRTAANPNAETSSHRTRESSRPSDCTRGRRTRKEQLVAPLFSTRSNNQETLLHGVPSNHPQNSARAGSMAFFWKTRSQNPSHRSCAQQRTQTIHSNEISILNVR